MRKIKTAILVTGAAGDLGKAIVEMAFSLPGTDIIIATDIKENVLDIYSQNDRVRPYVMDASSGSSVVSVRTSLEEYNIRVKYIVNNAGVFFFHPVSELTEELLDRILKVNTYAPVITVSCFLEHLKETQGRVVQISSCGVKFPTFFQSYPASKIAMEAFSVSMRQELNLLGIDLVLIRSGAIKTSLLGEMKRTAVPPEKSLYKDFYIRFLDSVNKNVGKVIEPSEAAKTVGKALTASKPKYIYTINRNRTISIMSLFPQRLRDFLLRQSVKK